MQRQQSPKFAMFSASLDDGEHFLQKLFYSSRAKTLFATAFFAEQSRCRISVFASRHAKKFAWRKMGSTDNYRDIFDILRVRQFDISMSIQKPRHECKQLVLRGKKVARHSISLARYNMYCTSCNRDCLQNPITKRLQNAMVNLPQYVKMAKLCGILTTRITCLLWPMQSRLPKQKSW